MPADATHCAEWPRITTAWLQQMGDDIWQIAPTTLGNVLVMRYGHKWTARYLAQKVSLPGEAFQGNKLPLALRPKQMRFCKTTARKAAAKERSERMGWTQEAAAIQAKRHADVEAGTKASTSTWTGAQGAAIVESNDDWFCNIFGQIYGKLDGASAEHQQTADPSPPLVLGLSPTPPTLHPCPSLMNEWTRTVDDTGTMLDLFDAENCLVQREIRAYKIRKAKNQRKDIAAGLTAAAEEEEDLAALREVEASERERLAMAHEADEAAWRANKACQQDTYAAYCAARSALSQDATLLASAHSSPARSMPEPLAWPRAFFALRNHLTGRKTPVLVLSSNDESVSAGQSGERSVKKRKRA